MTAKSKYLFLRRGNPINRENLEKFKDLPRDVREKIERMSGPKYQDPKEELARLSVPPRNWSLNNDHDAND